MKKILIWHQGALGDLILSLPAINAIRDIEGHCRLHLLSRTDLSFITTAANLADETSSCDVGFFSHLFADSSHMPSLLAAFLDRFDRAYVFMRNPNHYFLKNMLRHIRETVFISTMPEEGVRGHISRFQLDQIRASEYDKNEMPVMPRDLFMDSGIDTAATGKKVIAIHPGSGGKKKCWPLDNFLKLAEMFQIRGNFLVKFICGPDEDEKIVAKIMTFINEKGSDAVLLRDRPLPEIASLLASATLYIGNDSGISHLTSLTGVPELILFGPTDHEVWRPLGQNVTVIRSDIHCSPCGQEVYQECPDAFCLSGLAPERVFETAINIIIPKTAEPYSNAVTSVQTVINRNN